MSVIYMELELWNIPLKAGGRYAVPTAGIEANQLRKLHKIMIQIWIWQH